MVITVSPQPVGIIPPLPVKNLFRGRHGGGDPFHDRLFRSTPGAEKRSAKFRVVTVSGRRKSSL
ncbi:hypothetical protein [Amycolatopsis pigmentata]|uniref:Uncharacterized protein n=1 Tax=Amycolatopsis pigmentata TaxID=450801 RepID=A0ABW5FXL9_9PSEU